LLVNRALLELEREDFVRAEADLRAAIDLDGRRLEAVLALAQVYLKQGKPEAAHEELSRAISLAPTRAAVYRLRADVELSREKLTDAQRSTALADLQKSISLERPGSRDLAADYAKVARLLALERRDAEALEACNTAIEIAPDLHDAHRLRIDLLLRLKQYADVDAKRFADVDESCSTLIAQGRASSTLYEARALARSELKDFSGAIRDLTFAIEARPKHAPLLCQRGWLYFLVDAPRLAMRDFDAAIRIDRSCAEAYNGRGAARVRFLEYREAVNDAQQALSIGTPGPKLFYDAARVYAIAATVVAAEARALGRESLNLKTQYEDRAAALVHRALTQMPRGQRGEFVRRVVDQEPALKPLRRQIRFEELSRLTPASAAPNEPSP
jgi:tetratricopeptide (TPR) repeat protein